MTDTEDDTPQADSTLSTTESLEHMRKTADKPFNLYRNYDEALEQTVQSIAPQPGEHGLDIGTGTGNLAGQNAESEGSHDRDRPITGNAANVPPSIRRCM